MTNRITILMLLLTMNYISSAQNNDAFPVKVQIENGWIEGNYDTKSGIQKYFRIPYAKPPVEDLRWKAPQKLDNWKGVKETKSFGPRAVQGPIFGDMQFRSNGISEDCLYLNVWSPAKRNTKDLPVLVYFYGGGFVAGDGSEPRYDGESMAKKGIVAVTVNYRLNIFGFFSHPELSAEASHKSSGNYGLLDQQAALEWVKNNIAAFGGDPDKVTIAGESAGSISVSLHMSSPMSKDLIHGAIGESGASIHPTLAPIPLEEGEKIGEDFAKNAGFVDLASLRNASTREIYEIYEESRRFGFPIVVDNYFLPATLPELFSEGKQAQIPLLLGWNSAEIPGMAFMQGQPYSEEAYVEKVKQAYPKDYGKALELYPFGTMEAIEQSATDLASDRFIVYSTWKWFDLHRKNSGQPIYRYLYSKLRPPLADQSMVPGLAGGTNKKDENAPPPPKALGAPHACEIEYAMGNLHLVKDYVWTADDFKVSETMSNYFANFVKTGNPNGEGLPEWPNANVTDNAPSVMIIDTKSESKAAAKDERYLFLDRDYTKSRN